MLVLKMVENVIVAMKYHQKLNFKIPIALFRVLAIVTKGRPRPGIPGWSKILSD